MISIGSSTAALLLLAACASAPAPEEVRKELAPTGTLRAAFLASNPVQGRVDPKTGAVSGPAVDACDAIDLHDRRCGPRARAEAAKNDVHLPPGATVGG